MTRCVDADKKTRFILATANRPGAIAVIQLLGHNEAIVRSLTGIAAIPIGRARLVNFAGIDEGLVVRLTPEITQLMPHGGPRVVQRLTAKLIELGAECAGDWYETSLDPLQLYPEANDRDEAFMLCALSRAESPLAIDLLLDQPRRWREFRAQNKHLTPEDQARSQRLNHLISPPTVVVVGRPNVGKSTLSNALLGRAMSIALDQPGTTRDYTAGRIDLAGLVVNWYDTPGIRESDDPIEQRAIAIARQLIERADLLIAMTDPFTPWPELPRKAHLRVLNKVDVCNGVASASADIPISALTGDGLEKLVSKARDQLISSDELQHRGPWLFDARLLP